MIEMLGGYAITGLCTALCLVLFARLGLLPVVLVVAQEEEE